MIKEMLYTINHAMSDGEMSIECAINLLKSISVLTGKEYIIIRKRVAYRENGQIHDAWVNA